MTDWADMSEEAYWQAHGCALSTAREAAMEQIQVHMKLLADPMDGYADHVKAAINIESRQRIIEAGMLLATLKSS